VGDSNIPQNKAQVSVCVYIYFSYIYLYICVYICIFALSHTHTRKQAIADEEGREAQWKMQVRCSSVLH